MKCRSLLLLASVMIIFQGCYSLKGISISPTIQSFYVEQFQNGVVNAPPDIAQRFSDVLKDRVTRNTRLDYDEQLPDIEFSGVVSSFRVQSVAPERNTTADGSPEFGSALNRLNISVEVEYVNNQDDEDVWSQVFSFWEDYDNETVLSDVQDQLIENIFEQIATDIFNKSFTNW